MENTNPQNIPQQPVQPAQPAQPIPQQPIATTPAAPAGPSTKWNTAAMVLGIVAIALSISVFGAPGAITPAVVGLALAIVYKIKHGTKNTGLILSIVGLVLSILSTFLFVFVILVLVLGSGPIGSWDCSSVYGYDVQLNLDASGYQILQTDGYDTAKISGSSFDWELEDGEFTLSFGPVSNYTINSEAQEVDDEVADMAMIIDDAQDPREATLTTGDGVAYTCVERD